MLYQIIILSNSIKTHNQQQLIIGDNTDTEFSLQHARKYDILEWNNYTHLCPSSFSSHLPLLVSKKGK